MKLVNHGSRRAASRFCFHRRIRSSSAPPKSPTRVLTFLPARKVRPQSAVTIPNTVPWFAWIPIVAIICGTIGGVVKSVHCHNERMAMIRMGMHPDAKAEKPYYEEQEV